ECPGAREQGRGCHPTVEAFDGLVRTYRRRELALAEAPTTKVGADVGPPGDDERPYEEVEPTTLTDPQQGGRGQDRIEKARDVPANVPSAHDPGPFVEHRGRCCGDENGEDVSSDVGRQERSDDHDGAGQGADRKLVHRPPKRRSRAAEAFNA